MRARLERRRARRVCVGCTARAVEQKAAAQAAAVEVVEVEVVKRVGPELWLGRKASSREA